MNVAQMKKDIIKLITKGFAEIDTPTKQNTEFYRKMIDSMPEQKFIKWLKGFLEDPDQNLYLEIDTDNEPSIDKIQKAAKDLGIPLEYPVYYRHGIFANNPKPTLEPVMVGIIPIKMLQQTTPIKVKRGHNISHRSSRTGQVIGKSKVVAVSEPERNALLAIGATNTLKELTGPRADNQKAKQILYERIANGEPLRLADMPDEPEDKTSMVTLNVYLLGACLESDLLGRGMVLPQTKKSMEANVVASQVSEGIELNNLNNILTDEIHQTTDVINHLNSLISQLESI
jgi:hypothetical protein